MAGSASSEHSLHDRVVLHPGLDWSGRGLPLQPGLQRRRHQPSVRDGRHETEAGRGGVDQQPSTPPHRLPTPPSNLPPTICPQANVGCWTILLWRQVFSYHGFECSKWESYVLIFFTALRNFGRSQSQRVVKHPVEISRL